MDLFSSPLLRTLTTFLCVVAWLQPSSEYGILFIKVAVYSVLFPWLLCTVFFMLEHYLLEDDCLILDNVTNTETHCLMSCRRVFVCLFYTGFFCLSSLVESLLSNYTPAVLISDTVINAGSAVISDNGGHFLRISQSDPTAN